MKNIVHAPANLKLIVLALSSEKYVVSCHVPSYAFLESDDNTQLPHKFPSAHELLGEYEIELSVSFTYTSFA